MVSILGYLSLGHPLVPFMLPGVHRVIMFETYDNLYKMSTKQSEEIWKHLLKGSQAPMY